MSDTFINIPDGSGGGGGGVSSLNGQTGPVNLVAGTNITIVPGAGTLTINSTSAGSVNSVTATSPLFSSGGANPNLTIQQANTSQSGFLSSTDWNTFNSKQASGLDWLLLGNAGTTAGTNFLGTTDAQSLVFKTNSVEAMRIDQPTSRLFIGTPSSIGASNAGIQYADATTANRGQIKLHSYFNGTSIAGVSTLTSRSGTVGVNNAVVAGQDYSKWTAQAGATTVGSAPISGTFAFKANTVNSLTVTSDYHIQLTNLAGTLGDRLYLNSEGALQLPNYGVGIAHFDASGNITSSPISLTSDISGILPIANGGTGSASQNFVDLTTNQTVGGNKTFTGSISASNLSGTNTGDITIGTANGLSLAGQALSLGLSSTSTTGALSSTDWNTFNNKGTVSSVALTVPGVIFNSPVSGSPITTSGTLALALNTQTANTIFAGPSSGGAATPTFRNLVASDIPSISLTSGVSGTLPIANGGTGQTTANSAFNALAPSQTGNAGFFLQTNGTDTSWVSGGLSGTMPSGTVASTTVVTSATTTYVTAMSTTVTMTATSAPIWARAAATFTVTGTVPTVAKMRVSINGVAGQEQLLSLTAVTTNYIGTAGYLSANLGPGTYTILFEIARNSGTGTVSFFEGSLSAIGLQGANTNGITSITGGGLTVGPGSGAQTLSGTLAVANGGTGLSSTTINQLLYSSANNVVAGLATANTAALVTSSTGVPSWTSGATANRVLRTNGTTVSFAQVAAATDISGTLAVANGGTGLTSAFAANRAIFSNGTTLASDSLYLYQTANTRLIVGQGGGTGRINGTVSLTDPTPGDLAGNFFSRTTTNAAVNIQNENTLTTLDMTNSGGPTLGANILAEASNGTLVARTQSVPGDVLFTLRAHGRTASAYSAGLAAALQIITTDTVTDTTNGGEIVFSTTANSGTTPVERLRIKQSGETTLVNSHLKSTQTTAPTIAATANAGTGASASLANATDVAGQVTITTGTIGISTGSYATITFNKAYNVAPIVVLTPANSTISTSVYVTSTTTTFDINFALAGGISSTYILNYHVIETQ